MLVLFAAACSKDESPPRELLDGSRARPVPVELQGVDGPVVLTRVRVRRSASARGCADDSAREDAGPAPVVERVGVESESATHSVADGRWLRACDAVRDARGEGERWCGGAFGSLVSGRLQDPRLNVLCSEAHGEPIALAWVQPEGGTAYVAVEQSGYTEVYETAAGLPVRVATTTGVDLERATAELAISEHDAAGALARRYVLEAAVAG